MRDEKMKIKIKKLSRKKNKMADSCPRNIKKFHLTSLNNGRNSLVKNQKYKF